MKRLTFALTTATLVAGCASRPTPVASVTPPPVVATTVPMPAGASPGMIIPAALPDGGYATPNRDLTPAATIWHLRAALNVAALACRGVQETTIIAGYNALLAQQKATLTQAEASYAAEYRQAGGDWRDRYDDSMTRLYNFFSQSPARDGFCAAAAQILGDPTPVPAPQFASFAADRLAKLERPFVDFYRAYDAWRAQSLAPRPTYVAWPMIAVAAAPSVSQGQSAPAITSAMVKPSPAPRPRLELDPSVFQ